MKVLSKGEHMWARISLYTKTKKVEWAEDEWDECFTRMAEKVKEVFGERTGSQGEFNGLSGSPRIYCLSDVIVEGMEEAIDLTKKLMKNLKGTPDELEDFGVMFPNEHKCYWGHGEWSFC